MVHMYGTSQLSNAAPASKQSATKQLAFVLGLAGLALVVCCALVATSDLKGKRSVLYMPAMVPSAKRMALYGIGSGEEQGAANAAATAFATFEGQEEMLQETLADEYYVEMFEEIAESEETAEAVDEVKAAIDEAKNEHKILEAFSSGEDAPLE